MTTPWLAPLPVLVAAVGLIAAVLAGWLSPAEALAGFGNPAVITVACMFVLSAAVARTGGLDPIERWLASASGPGLSAQLLLLALVVGPLSAVVSNTAVVALFIPVVERWCRSLGVSPARMLLPLSFLTVLAGVGTLLGSSTNLVASSLADQLGYGPFGLLQFTPMALPLYAAGALLLALLAPWLLPRHAPGPGGEDLLRDRQGREPPGDRRDRLPWVLFLLAALLLLALWRSDALAIWALLAVIGLVLARVLTPQEVYAAVRWDVVVLLAALLPLAGMLGRTGADRWLVEHWTARVEAWPPYGLLIALYLMTALLTELVSNQAAVTLMLPPGLALGQAGGVSAQAALGVMTFAASHSFLTPIGYPTNTMVYALGGYSFLDFLRLGLPLTLLLSLLTPALALALSP
jgi:anion transporter